MPPEIPVMKWPLLPFAIVTLPFAASALKSDSDPGGYRSTYAAALKKAIDAEVGLLTTIERSDPNTPEGLRNVVDRPWHPCLVFRKALHHDRSGTIGRIS